MNIGVVTPQLNSYGGSEIYLLECLRRWQGVARLTVYTPSFSRALFREFGIGREVKVVKLPYAKTHDKRFSLFHEIVVMPRIWEQHIQQHDLYFLYLFPTQMIQRRPSVWFAAEPCRMIYDLRQYAGTGDNEIEVHFYPKLEYDHIRPSDLEVLLQVIEKVDSNAVFDRLAVNSRATGRYVENIYGKKADAVAYPGISLPADIGPPADFDKVLHIGRLWKHKRVDLALKAMALTNSPNKLILVGDGPEKPRLLEMADRLGLGAKVVFAGEISMAARERLFRECTCCVYTPVREPFGMVPLEAAAAGRPVVATMGGGYSEILSEEAAVFVPPYEGAIAQAIHRLMSDPQLAMKMGRAGRRIVKPCTWDRTASTLMKLFLETAEVPRRRAGAPIAAKHGHVCTKLGAHYYPWYRTGREPLHWNENREHAGVTDYPAGGPYSSTHRSVIERHLRQAVRAGLDFFLVNWQVDFRGVHPAELEATTRLFDTTEGKGYPVKLAINLAFDTEEPRIFFETIRTVKQEFMSRDVYHRHSDHPLLWFYFNDPLQGFFYHYYPELEALCRGIYPVATGGARYNKFMPRILSDFFKGWCFYSPLEVGAEKNREILWRDNYRDFSEEDGKVRIFTVCPGFDDSHLTAEARRDKTIRRVTRQGTKTYESMQRAALGLHPPPDYVVITSFNEYHENTHIEPSKKFGDLFLRSTRAFKERLLE
ncbi:MAG: glycosyltransferase [Candidatus Binatia bacterium]|jgi:glycosyltransferase involved in cell wall biosynthesis